MEKNAYKMIQVQFNVPVVDRMIVRMRCPARRRSDMVLRRPSLEDLNVFRNK